MNREAQHVFLRIQTAWDKLTLSMQKMYFASAVRPSSAYDIFRFDSAAPDDEVKFDIGPMVFNVPERVGRGHPLYIVVKGWLTFAGDDFRTGPLKTKSFGTELGYFRLKGGTLEHVYGVHYDLEEEHPGHPVFHAQIASQMKLAIPIRELFHLENEPTNLFQPKLPNIRIPTAQMDVFSAIVQLCADHLVYEGADETVQSAFREMRTLNDFFIGAAYRMSYLNVLPATGCYRAAHWYGSQVGPGEPI
jgi:hypothetical protein